MKFLNCWVCFIANTCRIGTLAGEESMKMSTPGLSSEKSNNPRSLLFLLWSWTDSSPPPSGRLDLTPSNMPACCYLPTEQIPMNNLEFQFFVIFTSILRQICDLYKPVVYGGVKKPTPNPKSLATLLHSGNEQTLSTIFLNSAYIQAYTSLIN